MNFNETLSSLELILQSESVPLIVGESGIGKTALIKSLCNKNKYDMVVIDANLLKEGEIGGLPIVEESIDNNGNTRKRTTYATHNKLVEIDYLLNKNQNSKVVLFIDEINRCEHAVQQELMNLILNREINGYVLGKRVLVVSAMNPENKFSSSGGNYSVVNMDPAQENRFVWIHMESNPKAWVKWALNEGNINEKVVEFIKDFPEYLHRPNDEFSERATPRSWERVSKLYSIYENKREDIDLNIFYNVVKGNVGIDIAQDFISFIENYEKVIISPEDLFNKNYKLEILREKILKANHSKLYVLCKNVLSYLREQSYDGDKLQTLCTMLSLYPVDLTMGILKEIKEDYEEDIYKDLLDEDKFIELFFSCFNL